MDSIGADALGAMWSETTLPCHTAGILLLFSDLLHQLLVGGALDDLVELGAVVPHEAHAAYIAVYIGEMLVLDRDDVDWLRGGCAKLISTLGHAVHSRECQTVHTT